MPAHQLTSMPVPAALAGDRLERIATLTVGDRHVHVLTEWEVLNGRAEAIRVDIRSTSVASSKVRLPVTAELLRRLPLGEVIAGTRRDLAWEGLFPGIEGDPRQRVRRAAKSGPQRGQPLDADDLAAIAAVYRSAWGGGSQGVTDAVAKAFNISRSTASKRIMKTRAAGLLDGIGPRR